MFFECDGINYNNYQYAIDDGERNITSQVFFFFPGMGIDSQASLRTSSLKSFGTPFLLWHLFYYNQYGGHIRVSPLFIPPYFKREKICVPLASSMDGQPPASLLSHECISSPDYAASFFMVVHPPFHFFYQYGMTDTGSIYCSMVFFECFFHHPHHVIDTILVDHCHPSTSMSMSYSYQFDRCNGEIKYGKKI